MARINTNVPSILAQQNLNRANDELTVRLERLSTGLRINRGADDPAGLITSERLRSEMRGIDQAIANSERASSVIAVAEGALIEVSSLLNSIKSLVVEAANTGGVSEEEIEANQLQVDSAIESITRIANSSNFAGLKLLNGELDYILSGVDRTEIAKAQVTTANFGDNDSLPVSVEVLQSAQNAHLFMPGTVAGSPAGTLPSGFTIEIAGNDGVTSISITSGTTVSDLITAVNTLKGATGVSASLVDPADSGAGMIFSSTGYGSDSFVSVERIGDQGSTWFNVFEALDEDLPLDGTNIDSGKPVTRDEGRDVTALVNGILATGDGLEIATNAPTLSVSLILAEQFNVNNSTASFTITGGGSVFQLGPQVSHSQQVSLGIQSIAASRLGGTLIEGELMFLSELLSGGDFDLSSGNLQSASTILESAIDEVAVLRGRLGAFERNTLETNIRSMQSALENVTASESALRDADFAAETSALTRAQILSQAGTSVLSIANSNAQNVLQLLG
jgi:flagellin